MIFFKMCGFFRRMDSKCRIGCLRAASHKLCAPRAESPAGLVEWMGAIQTQSPRMAEWAVGMRLLVPSLSAVRAALCAGEVLRMHVLRPTWHFVASRDARLMVSVSRKRLVSANASYARTLGLGIEPREFSRACSAFEKILCGGRRASKAELGAGLAALGMRSDAPALARYLMHAEAEGVLCGLSDACGGHVYALFEETVPPGAAPGRRDALALLAERYFRARSPAALEDFSWWAGIPISEARSAVADAGGRVCRGKFGGREMFFHSSSAGAQRGRGVFLIPAYDEYLIAYRDRSDVLSPVHAHAAHNSCGTFRPVVVCGGRVVGRWAPRKRRGGGVEFEFFRNERVPERVSLDSAAARYRAFLSS